MTLGLYIPAASPLHRLPAPAKVLGLAAAGIIVFVLDDPRWLGATLAVAVLLLASTRAPLAATARQLRPAVFVLVLIFLTHGAFTSWAEGLVVVLRFAALLTLALALTCSTRISELTDALERGLAPLARFGVSPAKVSLAISLALRFIPVLAHQAMEIRDAQRARGLDRNLIALALPLFIKTLRLADQLSEAIEARGWDPGGSGRAPDAAGENPAARRRAGR